LENNIVETIKFYFGELGLEELERFGENIEQLTN
jgi:hypothetical protein